MIFRRLFRFTLVMSLLLIAVAPWLKSEEDVPGDASITTDVEGQGAFSPYGEEEQSIEPAPKGLDERVSLDLRNIEVTEALRFLAMKGGLNLAISKSVQGRLMLLLNNVPIRDVLDIIVLTNELAYDKHGEIYYVMTAGEYQERYGKRFSDVRHVRIFQLRYAAPDQVFQMIDALKSEVGRVLVDQESGTALVMDTEESLQKIQQAIDALEQERDIRVFSLKYAKAEEVVEKLQVQLDAKKAGTITADTRSNQVIIQTLSDRMTTMEQLIQSLDKKTKEVLIVSKIIKVAVNDDLNAEIKWEGLFNSGGVFDDHNTFWGSHVSNALARSGESFVDDFVSIAPTTRPTAGSKKVFAENLIFGASQGGKEWEVLLNFLKTIGETKVLSSPRITVVSDQEAKIHVGDREAYVTTTTTTGQSTSTTAEQVTFIDIGIQLSVTPTINDDGFITMKIKPEISSVTRRMITPSENEIPIIDTSEVETTVMVKDGTSIV